ncbi:MAG: zf-HC2 domain-containing protein [Magnetococcales bacterium]|nr:zf-HC2 domain-containing protein [Magnetococcales bacterium]
MSCNPELVSAFLDGELDTIILEAVMDHLLNCTDCRATLSDLAFAREVIATISAERCLLPNPEGVTLSVMAAISNEKTVHPLPRAPWIKRLFASGPTETLLRHRKKR